MSATAPKARTKTKTKTKIRIKTKLKLKSKRAEANRRNAAKSTGPRTPEGKLRSRHNAVKHGETARSGLLPGEDADEFGALQEMMVGRLKPRNDAELILVERIAGDIWMSDRAAQSAGRRLAERLRHEPLEQTNMEMDEAIALGARLLWQPSFPLPFTKRFQIGDLTEPPCSENAIHPHHPARLRLRLERTVSGCDWLLERWGDLWQRLHVSGLWLSTDAFNMVRLMGKHAINMADDLDVAGVFLATLTLQGAPRDPRERESFDWKHAMIRTLVTYDTDQDHGDADMVTKHCEPFARRLAELPLAALAPRDDQEARGFLTALIKRELERISEIRATLQAIADVDLAEAPTRLAFETGHEGEKHRRYTLANERVLNRRFSLFLTTRKMSSASVVGGSLPVDAFDPPSALQRESPVEMFDPLSDVTCQSAVGRGQSAVDVIDDAGPPVPDAGKWIDALELAGLGEATGPGEPERPDEPLTMDPPIVHESRPEQFVASEQGVDGSQPAVSAAGQATCDDAHFLRNEAIDGRESATRGSCRFCGRDFPHTHSPPASGRSCPSQTCADELVCIPLT
jgi:hypothetical protein